MGSVQAPLCWECKAEHWPRQCPRRVTNAVTDVTQPVTEIGKSVTQPVTDGDFVTQPVTKRAKSVTNGVTKGNSVTNAVTRVTNGVTVQFVSGKHCPTCQCSRVYADNAARQRAYRERRG